MVKTNLSIPPLDHFHSSFIKTASIHKTDLPVATVDYLDMTIVPDKPQDGGKKLTIEVPTKEEFVFPGVLKNAATMEIKAFSKAISLSTKQVSSTIGKSQIMELDAMGIDSTGMVVNAMCNEKTHSMEKELYKKYTEIAGNVDSLIKPRQKFFKKIFKNMKFPVYIESNRQLVSKILGYGNLIAVKHRRGPANFVVVGPKLASMIQDCPGFVTLPLGKTVNTMISPIGDLAGMTVYTNTMLRWDDTSLLVGRSTKASDPGVYLIEMEDRIEEVMMNPANSDIKIVIHSRQAISEVGNDVKAKYLYVNLELNKAPWWRRWMKLI